MWWLPRLIAGYVDLVCATINESIKTVIHEVWTLCSQVVNGVSVVMLGFLFTPGYKSHLEHKNRIRKRVVPSKDRRRSLFAALVDDSEENINNVQTRPDTEFGAKKPEERLRYSPRHRINSSRKNNRGVLHSNPSLQRLNDLAHYHEHVTTGLMEDLFTTTILFIDRIFLKVRSLIRAFLEIVTLSTIPSPWWILSFFNPFRVTSRLFKKVTSAYQNVKHAPENLVHSDQLDVRRVQDIIEHAGYPYSQHRVVTDDGYVLLLERIPNPGSKHVLYLQHGVFDSAFAWVATGAAALAYRSHDLGYDVFLGNFRGNGDREHVRKNITVAEYWNFSINEHAFKDFPAFINSILQIKRKEFAYPEKMPPGSPARLGRTSKQKSKKKEEINNNKRDNTSSSNNPSSSSELEDLENDPQFKLSVISHSMGAAATLMYIVQCRLQGIPHHLSQAILLSPAGYHKKIPLLCKILGPIIEWSLNFIPIYVFRFPSNSARIWTAKAFYDVMNSGALGTLSALSKYMFGGDITDSAVTKVHNLAYNTFTGTAVPILRHFLQLYYSGKFQSYDYGTARNREIYGQPKPIDFLENYDLIDIPIHFCVGLDDNLISPSNVIHQYNVLREAHPELAFLKASKNGHLEFTLGLDEPLLRYMLEALAAEKKAD